MCGHTTLVVLTEICCHTNSRWSMGQRHVFSVVRVEVERYSLTILRVVSGTECKISEVFANMLLYFLQFRACGLNKRIVMAPGGGFEAKVRSRYKAAFSRWASFWRDEADPTSFFSKRMPLCMSSHTKGTPMKMRIGPCGLFLIGMVALSFQVDKFGLEAERCAN